MKILHVYKDIYPIVHGGIERYIHDLGVFLESMGHSVEILVAGRHGRSGETSIDGMKVIMARCLGRLLSNPVCPGFGRFMSGSDADLMHFHLPLPTAVLSWLANSEYGRRPYVITYHSDIVRQAFLMPFYGPFLRKFLRGASRIFATSSKYAETSCWISDLPTVRIIPIGADPQIFRPGDPSEKKNYFLFVGRFRKYKGIPILLDAWENIPHRKLVMVGGGPMLSLVKKRIAQRNLNIEIITDVTDKKLAELYRNARALILPSTMRSEAFGMVQVEAMACGTPVISTDIPTGVSWVNANSISGIIIKAGCASSLVTAVERMMDDEFRLRLSTGALERAKEMFNGPLLMSEVEAACDAVLSEHEGLDDYA